MREQLTKKDRLIFGYKISQTKSIIQSYIFMDPNSRNSTLKQDKLSEKVEIYFKAKDLNYSPISLEISIQVTNKPKLVLLKTEHATSFNNIFDFPQSLVLDYFFQVRQYIIVDIYSSSSQKKLLGSSKATVGEIINARAKGIQKDIEAQGIKIGLINFRGEKVEGGTNKYVEFGLVARNVDTGLFCFSIFGEKQCHWKLYKIQNDQQYLLFTSQSKLGKDNKFNRLKISQKKLCNNDYKQQIIFRFFQGKGNNVIGQAKTNLQNLSKGTLRYTLLKNNQQKGVILLENFKQTIKYDLTDYLASGMQMAMVVCIDFTVSNKIPNQRDSLHYVTPTQKGQYEEALHQVCNIVLDYDADKLVPTFGFGAKVNMPNFNTGDMVDHCFPINGNLENPSLQKLSGILQGYRKALQYLSFAGPTLFAPLLRQAMSVCRKMKDQTKQYMILLILTDGEIHDQQEVKDLVVKCGRLPLSIIIIGIGNNQNWEPMRRLDDNRAQMIDKLGNKTERDLVRYVQFSKHNNNGVQLARDVLEELPRQVEVYHQLVGLIPDDYKKKLKI